MDVALALLLAIIAIGFGGTGYYTSGAAGVMRREIRLVASQVPGKLRGRSSAGV
jgi:hypothetical protein